MRMRLPALILAGAFVLGAVFWIPASHRVIEILLRAPIVLWRQAAALLSPPPTGIEVSTSVPDANPLRASAPIADVLLGVAPAGDHAGVRRPVTSPRAPQRAQEETASWSGSASERLRDQVPSVTGPARGSIGAATNPGADATVAGSPLFTVAEPPVTGQPPVNIQPPAGVQPPSGLVPPGGIPLPTDGLLPPGGFPLSPNELLNALPVGSIIGPGGLAQLPGGVQLQLPGVTQPGQVQIGPVQVGPVQTGPIQVGGPSGPIQIGPVEISPLPR